MGTGRNAEKRENGDSEDKIRAKAEEISRKRIASGGAGDELSDWLEAEKAIKAGTPGKGEAAKPKKA